ncbi:MAG TPA: T9SS type A sorting domain-containing protein [Bacteroidia bacterium]
MRITLSLCVYFCVNLIFAQKSYYKSVNLKDQSIYNYLEGSQGRSVVYYKDRLYTICQAVSKYKSSNYYTIHLFFIKFNLNGDTLLTRHIYSDSINYVTALPKLQVNEKTNRLEFGFRYRRNINFISNLWFNQVEIDTNGFITNNSSIQVKVDSNRYSTAGSIYQLGRKKYALTNSFVNNNDTALSFVFNIENGVSKDTFLTFNNDTTQASYINKMLELNSNRFMIIETRKEPSQVGPYKGKTYYHLYDSTFTLLKKMEFNDYNPITEFTLDGDSVLIVGMESYTVQLPNNYIFYTLRKISPEGDVLLDWHSRKYKGDTARDDYSVMMLGRDIYIGSSRFLFKFENNELKILKDLLKVNPLDYCVMNDSMIAITGGYNKLSNIGIIKRTGQFTGIRTIANSSPDVKVYPNPSSGNLNIESDKMFNLQVSDVSGKLILEESNTQTLNLEPGIYFLKFFIEDSVFVEKVFVY